MVVLGITTWMTEGVVKVEFGLEGNIQGCKVCQECLHNHSVKHSGVFSELFITFDFRDMKRLCEGKMSVLTDI